MFSFLFLICFVVHHNGDINQRRLSVEVELFIVSVRMVKCGFLQYASQNLLKCFCIVLLVHAFVLFANSWDGPGLIS